MTTTAINRRKAAILITSLEREVVDSLLNQMSEQEARTLRRAALEMGPIDPDEQQRVIEEFFSDGAFAHQPAPRNRAKGSYPPTSQSDVNLPSPNTGVELHLTTDPDSSETVSQPLAGGSELRPFDFLRNVEPESLIPVLKREHPQTVALVVSYVPPGHAAKILSSLSADMQADVMHRLVNLDDTNPEVLQEVERVLAGWAGEQSRKQERRKNGMQRLGRILEATRHSGYSLQNRQDLSVPGDSGKSPAVMNLDHTDQATDEIHFSDLENAEDQDLATIVRACHPDVVMLALVGGSEQLLNRVLSQLPIGENRSVRRQLINWGPTRLSDVEQAKQSMVTVARQLVEKGEIELSVRDRISFAA